RPASTPFAPSLHDALPILRSRLAFRSCFLLRGLLPFSAGTPRDGLGQNGREYHVVGIHNDDCSRSSSIGGVDEHAAIPRLLDNRSEEHTSELQSRFDLVCR